MPYQSTLIKMFIRDYVDQNRAQKENEQQYQAVLENMEQFHKEFIEEEKNLKDYFYERRGTCQVEYGLISEIVKLREEITEIDDRVTKGYERLQNYPIILRLGLAGLLVAIVACLNGIFFVAILIVMISSLFLYSYTNTYLKNKRVKEKFDKMDLLIDNKNDEIGQLYKTLKPLLAEHISE